MRVSCSSSSVRAIAWARVSPSWCSMASLIWSPMVCSGFSADMGSWNTMPIWPPRKVRRVRSSAVSTSCPSKRIWPSYFAPSVSRISACAVSVLPEPDSPTSATRWPRPTVRLTSCTMRCIWPAPSGSAMPSPRTSSSDVPSAVALAVPCVVPTAKPVMGPVLPSIAFIRMPFSACAGPAHPAAPHR